MGRPPKHDLSGQTFGDLYVVRMVPKGPKNTYFPMCKCICGKITYPSVRDLKKGRCISCGCSKLKYNKLSGSKSKQFKGYGEITGKYWSHINGKSKERKHEMNISIDYAWDLFIKQNRKCALTGLELSFASTNSKYWETTASLDRIDSSKGYLEGNVQWVHKDINKMKLTHSTDKFIDYCKLVYLQSLKKR